MERQMKNLNTYLDHIQYGSALAPTFDTLYQLHLRHTQSIPFENLSSFTGAAVRLDIPALLEKFTVLKRGGYCYEQNALFQYVLEQVGFKTTGLAARVRLNVADDVVTPRSHMLLLVEADGEQWIADTGFGGMTLTVPIPFVMDEVHNTPHGQYRLTRGSELYRLEIKVKEEWKLLYVFDLTAHYPTDYEVFNWYVSTNPTSHFVTSLVAARPEKAGRHALLNTQYSFYPLMGEPEKKQLGSVNEIKDALEDKFHIRTPDVVGLDGRLKNLMATAKPSTFPSVPPGNENPVITERRIFMKKFSKGDSVEWNTPQGKTSGKVVKKVTKPVKVGNYTAKASKANPEYEVETTKSHKVAVHKPESLKKK
jgi:N-hydroxyarylamine O-acetyltransferase